MNLPLPVETVEKLAELQTKDEWAAFIDLSEKTIAKWRLNLSRFSLQNDSIEQIAKDRIRWTSMIAGIEAVFLSMDQLIKELKEPSDE